MPTTVQERRARPDRLFVPDKEDGYVYQWFNSSVGPQGDQNLYIAQYDGWEPAPVDPAKMPAHLLSMTGQSTSQSGGGLVHRRGDLTLYRMRKELWEENVHSQTEEARKRADTTVDTMVQQAQENAARQLRDRGQKRIPSNLVFRENVGDPTD